MRKNSCIAAFVILAALSLAVFVVTPVRGAKDAAVTSEAAPAGEGGSSETASRGSSASETDAGASAASDVPAEPGIYTAKRFPVEGEPIFIYVRGADGYPVKGAVVSVTYRPGSKVEKTDKVGLTNLAGIVAWTPEDAGIVRISAKWGEAGRETEISKNTSVKFASTPKAGIAIMLVAGLILIGGSIRRFVRLVRSPA